MLFLPVLEHCSAVWCSAADTHLKLLDRVVSSVRFLTWVCLSVTLYIVDVWQCYVCCIRLGICVCCIRPVRVTRTRCSGCTSVYLCASSLQNLAVPQDLYSHFSVPVERSCWPCIRWCGTDGFQELGKCFFIDPSCSIRFLSSENFPFLFFLSVGWYCWVLGLWTAGG